MEMDTRMPNAATFSVQREDHTLGNILACHLQQQEHVLFAGYKVPHPLEHMFELKVQTDSTTTPTAALQQSIDGLIGNLGVLEERFKSEIRKSASTSANINGATSSAGGTI